jgi:GntR family transcriptional regulator, transcriptional repressor for pyruvate dehydrogenase complex
MRDHQWRGSTVPTSTGPTSPGPTSPGPTSPGGTTSPPVALVRRQLLDDVAEGILDLIRTQGLGAGDRLPSARELAARFAVATPTLREALRRLEATGTLDIRHGSGVYVRDVSRLILANPNHRGLAHETILHLLAARELIEPHLAEMAAQVGTPDQVAELRAILDQASAALSDDAALAASNMAFHRAIAHAAGNPVLAEMIDTIVDIYEPEQQQILRLHGDRRADHAEHTAVLTAIAAHEPAQAASLMRSHIAGVRHVVGAALRTRS